MKAANALAVIVAVIGSGWMPSTLGAEEILYGTEGNRLRRYDVDTIGSGRLVEEILVERAGGSSEVSPGGIDAINGRDINGQICFFPDGSGRFVAGEDTGQPLPLAGWGVFDAKGEQIAKLTATYLVAGAEPHGCALTRTGSCSRARSASRGSAQPADSC